MTWAAAITEYITSLLAANYAATTVRLHRHYLRQLRQHAPSPRVMTRQQIRHYLATPGWAAETRKSARTVAVVFFRWAVAEGIVEADPTIGLAGVSVPAGRPRPAPESVLAQSLAAAGPRERLMLLLAAHAGLRCCEIARVAHEDLVGTTLRVVGKGGKVRDVPILNAELLVALRGGQGYLFPGSDHGHLSPAWVSRRLARIMPDGWTAHTLRHRMATRAYDGTRDLLAVGAVLGHSKPETTLRYVQLPDDALRRAVAAAC